MSDINELLSKHFVGETNSEEELLVQQFKSENEAEYQSLKAFWTNKGIQVKQYDKEKAWQKISQQAPKRKTVSIYRRLIAAASVAAVFLLVSFMTYQFFSQNNSSENLLAVTNTEGSRTINLDDGSIVYLNKNATLSYPKTFDDELRQVTLKGEAFFKIAKDTQRPFRILTNHSEVEVLGTSFNINTEVKQTTVAVATGKVKVKSLATKESAILTPNQSAVVNQSNFKSFPTKDQNYQAWKTGIFEFEKTPIKEVIATINPYYDNQIKLSKANATCPISSTFNQLKIDEIVEILQTICKLKLKQNNKSYELH